MARFSFFTTMHHAMGQESLKDVVGIMGKSMRCLGHEAVLDPKNEKVETAFVINGPNDYNIMVEGFNPAWVEFMRRAKDLGAKFIILATEEPTPKGFNWGRDLQMRMRQEIFPEAAKHSVGILHLVPGQHVTDWYGQFAPSAFAELGYAPTLMRAPSPPPDYEFGFYGSLTPRRRSILKHLANMTGKQKAVKIVNDFKDQTARDAAMQRAKVILQIRKFDEMGLVSSSRCNTALMLGRPVIAEPHELSKPWDEVVDFAQTMDQFYSMAMFAASMWKPLWAKQLEKFKAKLTPEFCIGEPLKKIGITTQQTIPPVMHLPNLSAMMRAEKRRRMFAYGEGGRV